MNNMSNVIGKLSGRLAIKERSIGAILIDAGRLTAEEAELVVNHQQRSGLRFGEAAIDLGILSREDIDLAMARQFEYPYLRRGESRVSSTVMAAYEPFTAKVEALRALRSRLMLRWMQQGTEQKVVAIVSPDRGEGRSWLAANLGVVFSQLGEKTLIVDADLRHPRQHELFGIENRCGLSEVLAGRSTIVEATVRIPSLLDLSVVTSGALPPNPQEMVARSELSSFMRLMNGSFDVIIVDTPAASESSDGQIIAMRAGSALVAARRGRSRSESMRKLLSLFEESGIKAIGSVLIE